MRSRAARLVGRRVGELGPGQRRDQGGAADPHVRVARPALRPRRGGRGRRPAGARRPCRRDRRSPRRRSREPSAGTSAQTSASSSRMRAWVRSLAAAMRASWMSLSQRPRGERDALGDVAAVAPVGDQRLDRGHGEAEVDAAAPCGRRPSPPPWPGRPHCGARPARRRSRSLHRHGLREVARLVDVGALEHGGVVGEELRRGGVDDRRDEGVDRPASRARARRPAPACGDARRRR